jgi:flavodoxin
MDPCVVYFSRTGNTKQLAQAIADNMNAPLLNIEGILPSTVETFDPLILGAPVNGASPAKEMRVFMKNMNKVEGKRAILFCTYRLFGNKRTLKAMEKELASKGYTTIYKLSKKVKSGKGTDFSQVLQETQKVLADI